MVRHTAGDEPQSVGEEAESRQPHQTDAHTFSRTGLTAILPVAQWSSPPSSTASQGVGACLQIHAHDGAPDRHVEVVALGQESRAALGHMALDAVQLTLIFWPLSRVSASLKTICCIRPRAAAI